MTEHIGRFHIRKRLGGGGFGEVFLAEDPTIGRQVAIKVFRPKDENLIAFATSSDSEGLNILRERFLNEARILAQLEDAVNVVNVLDYGELADGAPYYVMPYLPHSLADELGKDVFDSVALEEIGAEQRPRALPLERCLEISEQLLRGLSATHAKGLVHRDIKPANVLLTESGDVRLADFGIAKAPDGQHSTVSHLGMGSRNYMAPEQRESAKHVDARADVYAVGRVMYRMLTGKLPVGRFADPNVVVPALGKAMNDVILSAIAEDRADRPKDAGQLLGLFLQSRASVGQQEVGEHSGTWAGGQGHSSLRDELRPLRTRVLAVLGDYGFVPAAHREPLRAMAAVADLDAAGLDALVADGVKDDAALLGKQKLAVLLRNRRQREGIPVPQAMLGDYAAAAAAVGWNAIDLNRVALAIEADLREEPAVPTTPSLQPPPAKRQAEAAVRARWRGPVAAMAVLALAGWGVASWRSGQLEDEARERAISVASEQQRTAWQQAALANTIEAYRAYLQAWPSGDDAAEAARRIATLEEDGRRAAAVAAQQEAESLRKIQRNLRALGLAVTETGAFDTQTEAAIRAFEAREGLAHSGRLDATLTAALEAAILRQEESAWAAAVQADTEAAYRDYERRYPGGRHLAEVPARVASIVQRRQDASERAAAAKRDEEAKAAERERLAAADRQDWANAGCAIDRPDGCSEYLTRQPAGAHASIARSTLEQVRNQPRVSPFNEQELAERLTGWQPMPAWRSAIEGRRIQVVITPQSSRATVAGVLARASALGASVELSVVNSPSVGTEALVEYPPSEMRAASALQAAIVEEIRSRRQQISSGAHIRVRIP